MVATASGSTSIANPRASGHSRAAAIDRMPGPAAEIEKRSHRRLPRGELLGHRDHRGASTRDRRCRRRARDRCRSPDRPRRRRARPSSAGPGSCARRAAPGSTSSRRRATRPRAPRGGERRSDRARRPPRAAGRRPPRPPREPRPPASGAHCATITARPAPTRRMVSASRISTPPVSAPTASASTSATGAGPRSRARSKRVATEHRQSSTACQSVRAGEPRLRWMRLVSARRGASLRDGGASGPRASCASASRTASRSTAAA